MKVIELFCYVLTVRLAVSFSFRSKAQKETVMISPRYDLDISLSEMLQSGSRLSDTYSIALHELQDLESEPLCHRIAARLLVVNCQLLDGKDEATILTDSGRQIRDFVDAYAASMAICDLERGRFKIPTACEKFREPTLVKLPTSDSTTLHVNSREIDLCLSGLGEESSAWSTWISYRHKALRFCEAARADQEKAQNILLYQRLTKVMAKMTHGVESELQRHMDNLELRAHKAAKAFQDLEPEFESLRAKMATIEKHLAQNLEYYVQRSGDAISHGLKDANQLQRMLTVMIQTVSEGKSQFASAQENYVALVEGRQADLDHWAAAMATAAASAQTLYSRLELSRIEMEAHSMRQQTLSTNLERLVTTSENLSSKYDAHTQAINEARNMTNEILETLESVTGTAAMMKKADQSRWLGSGFGGWVPYIISPAATLSLGSYGLAPSGIRNFGLIVLGEMVGFCVTHVDRITMPWMMWAFDHKTINSTMATL